MYDGYTPDGTPVSCDVDEGSVIYGDGLLTFKVNPDFPQDAKALFEALCNVREVLIEKCMIPAAQESHQTGEAR